MHDSAPPDQPLGLGLLLIPGFSMMAFSSAVEPLRAANRLAERPLYRWRLFSPDGGPIAASNGIALLAEAGVDGVPHGLAALAVCAGLGAEAFAEARTLVWLRRLAQAGVALGGLSTGSYVLARAGLLEGYRCTVHWESLASFAEVFPRLETTGRLFEIDRNRFTCAGGTAALDMMLHVIGQRQGPELAASVAEQFIHAGMRHADDPQRLDLRQRLRIAHPRLLKAIAEMEANLEFPLSAEELARRVGLSTRQVHRLFRSYLKRTPQRHYLELRLKRARSLLEQTPLSVVEVAAACGFASPSHFAKCYRALFGVAPRAGRRRAAP